MFRSTERPFVVIGALLVLSAPLYFARGIGIFDDSLYLKAGQLILDGLKPYRDFYDNKPPGVYYVSAAIASVSRGWLAPRIFLFLFAATFQVAFIRWVQNHFGGRAATIAAVFVGLSYPLAQGYSLHTEPFGAAACLAACALVLTDAPALGQWAAAGALLGLATVFKQTGVLYVAAFGLFAAFDVLRRGGHVSALARTLGSLSGGFLATLAAVALIFVTQDLGRPMFEAVVIGAINRGQGDFASRESIVFTWLICPALVAFLGVVFVLVASPNARQMMDGTRNRAFVLFALIGSLSILPTIKTNLAGHYLQPGAFALSAACALFLDAYLTSAGLASARLVKAVAIALVAGYAVGLSVVSVQMLRQHRLRTDLALQHQLRETLDTRLDSNQTVLCISISSAARLYLMSGRRPFNQSLYYYPTIDEVFSLDDARRALLDGRAPGALVEIHPEVGRPELNEVELATLRSTYEIIPVGPQTDHRLLAFIRYNRTRLSSSKHA